MMARVFASCGHEVFSGNDCVPVEYTDSEIDFDMEAIVPVTIMATFCPACAAKISQWSDGRVVR